MRPSTIALAAWAALVAAPGPCLAEGEPVDGFPSYEERLVWTLINEARVDPATALAGCSSCAESACYSPVAPLAWNHEMGRAARLHGLMQASCGCALSSNSPCTLVDDIATAFTPGPCDGSAECACQEGVPCPCSGSSFSQRMAYFGVTARSEYVVSSSGNPANLFEAWLWAIDTDPTCGTRPANSSRANMLDPMNTGVGIGYADGEWWTLDYGDGVQEYPIAGGAHVPNYLPQDIRFMTVWHSDAGPSGAWLNLDGTCTPLDRTAGTGASGAWSTTQRVEENCLPYLFAFEDASGNLRLFPETGAFLVGPGCDPWTSRRPSASNCDFSYPDPGCGCALAGAPAAAPVLAGILLAALLGLSLARRRW